ncbi:hypothetical protein [Paenibacillus lautus]|uniref:hypothetical protein n=1 Tax=Paenibacillus lautus TaxID=1401 RepID=UPI002DB6BBA7|nr:hypothetical protein [Paenibacillus lautus]MEC0259360.1 hypothetical protein [Paenibacillus lautus]
MSDFQGGKVVSFRLPHDVPHIVSEYLDTLKKTHDRKFSREIADRFVQAIEKEALFGRPHKQLVIPYPENLTDEEKIFLNSDRTKALIGQLVVHLLSNPSEMALPRINTQLPAEEQTSSKREEPFITNETITSFVEKTFLNFDDDD